MDCSPSQACVMVSFVSDCIQSDDPNIARTALTDLRGVDHVGITVPDMQEAEDFLVDVLGAVPVYSLPGKSANDDWMSEHLGVHPRTTIKEIRFYRLGNGGNLEVFTYDAADGQAPHPRNSDVGGHHLALYVDDIDRAVDYLRSRGVDVMGERREQGRVARAALGLLPRTMGDAVRARQLPERQSVRIHHPLSPVAPGRRLTMTAASTQDPSIAGRARLGDAGSRIAHLVRDGIICGEFVPGTRIRQEDLAERFGASRVPCARLFANSSTRPGDRDRQHRRLGLATHARRM